MTYETIASAAPYFDDFDETKNFLRILFNPSRAVQSRELTQLQTILQSQIGNIAGHIFKENSPVFQAIINVSKDKPVATVQSDLTLTSDYIGAIYKNASGKKTFKITGYQQNPGEAGKIYYEVSGQDLGVRNTVGEFVSSEVFTNSDGLVNITIATEPSKALVASVGSGVIWARGHFVTVNPQEIVLTDVSAELSDDFQVGFVFDEQLITANDDNSLFDNAAGFTNFNAPGADRYKIVPVLTAYNVNDKSTLSQDFLDQFAPFVYVSGGVIVDDLKNRPQYADIMDVLARRTYDTNGNFSVRDFNIQIREATDPAFRLMDGNTTFLSRLQKLTGYVDGQNDANDYLVATLGEGKAYVYGYEIEKILPTDILVLKGRERQTFEDVATESPTPFHFFVNPSSSSDYDQFDAVPDATLDTGGWLSAANGTVVNIHNTNDEVISQARIIGIDRSGNFIRVFLTETSNEAIESPVEDWDDATAYVAGDFAYYNNSIYERLISGTTTVNPQNDPQNWYPVLKNTKRTIGASIQPIDFSKLSNARYLSDPNNTAHTVKIAIDASDTRNPVPRFGGNVSPLLVPIVSGIEVAADHDTTFNSKLIREFAATTDGTGSIQLICGANQTFDNQDLIIYAYSKSGTPVFFGQSQMTVAYSGDQKSITISFVDSNDVALVGGISIVVAVRINAPQLSYRTKSINTTSVTMTVPNSASDGQSYDVCDLGQEDCIKIVSVYQLTNNVDSDDDEVNNGTGRQLTTEELLKLRFDTGQRDFFYDKGSVSGFSSLWGLKMASLASSTQYKITFRYYTHSSGPNELFFSLNSYGVTDENDLNDIPVYRSQNFGGFDLMNCLDYRRKLSEFASGVIWPSAFAEVDCDSVEQFVGRIDKIWLDPVGNFGITRGIASASPVAPKSREATMLLYTLSVPPYTFEPQHVSIAAEKNTRYTMKDIGKLEDRIKRLEEYVSLTMLEKNAADMSILDPLTGLDRFKSGIFTDSFASTDNAEVLHPLYRITIDGEDSSITTPVQFWNSPMVVCSVDGDEDSGNWSASVHQDIVTLPITGTKVLAENLLATATINLNPYLFYVWRGGVEISPAVDTWYETEYLPVQNVTVGSFTPPPGFNPNPRVNEITQSWTGFFPGNVVFQDPGSTTPTRPAIDRYGNPIEGQETLNLNGFNNPNQIRVDGFGSSSTFRIQGLTTNEVSLPPANTIPNLQGLSRVGTNRLDAISNGELRALFSTRPPTRPNSAFTRVDARITTRIKTWDALETRERTVEDDRLIDTTSVPFMRPRTVNFSASGLRPGVQVECFFDGRKIPFVISETYKTSDGRYITNSDGKIDGWFLIPERQFTTGEKQFSIVDVGGSSGGTTTYTAKGYLNRRQKTITTIRSVEIVTRTEATQDIIGTTTFNQPTVIGFSPAWADPLAQSILVDTPGGCFVKEIDVYFATKSGDFTNEDASGFIEGISRKAKLAQIYGTAHPTDLKVDQTGSNLTRAETNSFGGVPVTIYIVEMENGIPTSNIVPLSKKTVYPKDINSHPTIPSLSKTTIEWDNPIYLQENTEYAIVLRTSSKEYYVWTSELGKQDIFENGASNPGAGIAEQPYLGSLFLSQNSKTWTAEQFKDLTFQLRICQFDDSGVVLLRDDKAADDNKFAGTHEIWGSEDFDASLLEVGDVVFYAWTESDVDYSGFFKVIDSTGLTASTPPREDETGTLNSTNFEVIDSNSFIGDRGIEKRYCESVFPMIGNMVVPGTSIEFQHKFHTELDGIPTDANWETMVNLQANRVVDYGPSTGEKYLSDLSADPSDRLSYGTKIQLSTSNANISPVLDKQQMRVSLIRKVVDGLDPDLLFGGYSVVTLAAEPTLAAAYARGAFEATKTYNKNDVVYVSGSPTVFYKKLDSSAAYANETAFFAGVNAGEWEYVADYIPPFIDGNKNGVIGDAGTYITKTVYLATSADDLRVVFDAMLNGGSYLNVFYRTQEERNEYVWTSPYRYLSVNSSDFANKKFKVFYHRISTNETTNETNSGSVVSPTVFVTGIETSSGTSRLKVNVSSASTNDIFEDYVDIETGYDENGNISDSLAVSEEEFFANGEITQANLIFLIPEEETSLDNDGQVSTDFAAFDAAGSYVPGDVCYTIFSSTDNVFYDWSVWKSNAYIAPLYDDNSSPYSVNDIVVVEEAGNANSPYVAYRCTVSSPANDDAASPDPAYWEKIVESNGVPALAYLSGTIPTEVGNAWTRIPSLLIRSNTRRDFSNDWKPMTAGQNQIQIQDGRYYEYTYNPSVAPSSEFSQFQIRIDFRSLNRYDVPKVKNLRAISLI